MIQLTCTFSIDNHWRYGSLICITTLLIHVRSSISPQSCIAYTLGVLQSCTLSISTGHVIPLSCTIPIDYHSRYCTVLLALCLNVIDNSYQGAITNWSYNQIEFSGDEIIEIMKRNWLNLSHFANYLSKSTAHMVCCEQLFETGKRLLPKFSKYKFGGKLRPTNTVAQRSYRAIPENRANGVI